VAIEPVLMLGVSVLQRKFLRKTRGKS
jgi:hypothetical protein